MVILVIGLGAIALGVVAAIWFGIAASRAKDRTLTDAPQILDELFSGGQVVTYSAGFVALPFGEVVKGASERGYELLSSGDSNSYGVQELVFRKVD